MERVVALSLASCLLLCQPSFGGMPLISSDAFVQMSVSPTEAVLPVASPFGTYSGRTAVRLRVVSNRAYGVAVSFGGFVHERGAKIARDDTWLTVNEVAVPVGREVRLMVDGRTGNRGAEFPLNMDFKVRNMQRYMAGAYAGRLAVAVVALR